MPSRTLDPRTHLPAEARIGSYGSRSGPFCCAEWPGVVGVSGPYDLVQYPKFGVRPTVRAGGDAVSERPERLFPLHPRRPLPRHVASPDVDIDGRACPYAALDEPVRLRWPCSHPPLPLDVPPFLLGDPPPRAVKVGDLDAFEESEQVEAGQSRVVHVFDNTALGCAPHTW